MPEPRAAKRNPHTLISRRRALHAAGGGVSMLTALRPRSNRILAQSGTPVAAADQAAPELASLDAVMADLMTRWGIPGGQLAVARDGRLVLDRGYGLADLERAEAVRPTSLFRIASVSKAVTAVAVLTLVDSGALALDEPVFPLLALLPPANAPVDPRLADITVQDLLVHAGGWDSALSFDPQGLPFSRMAAASVGLADPAEARTIVRFMLGEPLDFTPGTRQAYSNFGFNVLGRVIEQVAGQPYGDYVREHVLAPAGITGMRLGRTRMANLAPNEVHYYGPPDQPMGWSVFWGEGFAPFAYGGSTYLEALDAHGGWIASAADLVRFATAVDGQRGPALLTPAMVETMINTPRPPTGTPSTGIPGVTGEVTAGLGWDVTPVADAFAWSRVGALMGSAAAWLTRRPDGVAAAFTFNLLPVEYNDFLNQAIATMDEAITAIRVWPDDDLFQTEEPTGPDA